MDVIVVYDKIRVDFMFSDNNMLLYFVSIVSIGIWM